MTTKITIHGTAPEFDQAELERRQAGYHAMYKQTSQCMELVRAAIPYEFLVAITEKSKLGYMISSKQPITTQPLDYSAYLIKPLEIQQVDLEAIDARVRLEYITDLEREREEYRQLLTTQLLQAAALKEQKKLEDKQAKLLAEIQREVNDVFGEFVVPDGLTL
ncbi:hypothetical protein [Pseudomonas kilonensis]|uniref:Uncharacterized protein n=1 Tax=Pseudomonas kilonensis TaxID=132476 RepID=A0ABY0Z9E3_9PSED|nr:hypothetical protein [Pseudomonas kilonensis]SEE44954.1 hypothetical protein SAMN04490188_3897 [Pseudomonas kilonensis]